MRHRRDPRLTASATVLAAFCVHQLRYALVPDAAADTAHGYLTWAPQIIGGAFALSVGLALARAARGRVPVVRAPRSPLAAWSWCSLALLAIFCVQELAEGHVAALDGHGGWIALPLTAAFGWLLSRLLWRVDRAIAWLAGALRARARAPRPTVPLLLLPRTDRARSVPRAGLARPGAGRAPPAWAS